MKVETRYRGKEVRHVDGTAYCVSVVSKTNRISDEGTSTEDASSVRSIVLPVEEEDF